MDRISELTDRNSALEASVAERDVRIEELEERIRDSTDRAARNRDSIVSLRHRLNEVRAERHKLQEALDAADVAAETTAVYVEGFNTGSSAVVAALFRLILDRISPAKEIMTVARTEKGADS